MKVAQRQYSKGFRPKAGDVVAIGVGAEEFLCRVVDPNLSYSGAPVALMYLFDALASELAQSRECLQADRAVLYALVQRAEFNRRWLRRVETSDFGPGERRETHHFRYANGRPVDEHGQPVEDAAPESLPRYSAPTSFFLAQAIADVHGWELTDEVDGFGNPKQVGPVRVSSDGSSLSVVCGEVSTAGLVQQQFELEPNGYFWAALAAHQEPDLVGRMSVDPEAGSVRFDGKAADVAALRPVLERLAGDEQAMTEAVDAARAAGVDLED